MANYRRDLNGRYTYTSYPPTPSQAEIIESLVAALEGCRTFFNDLKRDEADVDEFLETIDSALALARKGE